jgi:uncharacterized protein
VFVELGPVQIELPEQSRLALISDTHIFPSGQRQLPGQVLDLFGRAGVDQIIHAGDIACQTVLDELAAIAPVLAVRGNNDHGEFGKRLPLMIELIVGDQLVRVTHGHGGRSARSVATSVAHGAGCVIYGHSHIPMVERAGGAVLVNPGSPCDRRWHPHFGVAFLEIGVERIRPELILFTGADDLAGVNPKWQQERT